MKNYIAFLSTFIGFLYYSVVFGQANLILCNPCVQKLIKDNNITDVRLSRTCEWEVLFYKGTKVEFLRYTDDLCNTPQIILPVVCDPYYSIGITCSNPGSGSSSDIIDCHGFENLSLGNFLPQGSPAFSAFSGLSTQNATITNLQSFLGSKSLRINHNSDIDYNVSRNLTESRVARLEIKTYVPNGRTGRVSLETNSQSPYNLQMEFKNNNAEIWIRSNVGLEKVKNVAIPTNRWFNLVFIFRPYKDFLEIWIDNKFEYRNTSFQSNKVEDLNFGAASNTTSTEFYVDELCYKEYTLDNFCTLQLAPVCAYDEEFSNSCFAFLAGYNIQELYDGRCNQTPECTNLTSPTNGQTNVPTSLKIIWNRASGATKYFLDVGTSNSNTSIVNNLDVGNVEEYQLNNLPANSEICVKIKPMNAFGITSNCPAICFKTQANSNTLLICPQIQFPLQNSINVATNFEMKWTSSLGSQGYKLRATYNNGNNIILNNLDIGNKTSYMFNNLPNNTKVCLKLTPYSSSTENTTCTETCFSTQGTQTSLPSCITDISPPHNTTNVSQIVDLKWTKTSLANGYILRVGYNPTSSELLNNLDISDVNKYTLKNLPSNTQICFTIIPYNNAGQNLNCGTQCFKTATASSTDDLNDRTMFVVKPNPTSGLFSIDFLNIHKEEIKSIFILDINGNRFYQTSQKHEDVDVSHLPDGIYIIGIQSKDRMHHRKLFIVR